MKALIVYYSLAGTTKKLAERMAQLLQCDAVKIPVFGSLKIDGDKKYDIVIIGTPIWLYAPTFPVSRFLTKNRGKLPKVAFFCTYQTTIKNSFEKMAHRCGAEPIGTLKLKGPEIVAEAGDAQLKEFVEKISR